MCELIVPLSIKKYYITQNLKFLKISRCQIQKKNMHIKVSKISLKCHIM